MEIISYALVGAIISLTWEMILRTPFISFVKRLKHREIIEKTMSFSGDIYISKSIPSAVKPVARLSDVVIEKELEKFLSSSSLLENFHKFDAHDPSCNMIIIGSTRYNMHARDIQENITPQFEYISDVIDGDPDRNILSIVNKYGDIYFSSVDIDGIKDDFEVDYGILVHVRFKNNKRVLWISGIHGAGSLGVYKYFKDNPAFFADVFAKDDMASFLFRVKYDRHAKNESLKMINGVEVISKADSCGYRKKNKPSVIICDFGNVIMLFDRNRTYRAIAHWLKRPYVEIKDIFENNDGMRCEYEKGYLTDEEFYANVLSILNTTSEAMPFAIFEEFWGDIFWPDNRMIQLLSELSREYKLILLSNTNGIHFNGIREHYPGLIELFEGRLILSYEVKLSKPDRNIFHLAIDSVSRDVSPENCVYVDDKEEYVNAAIQIGMKGIVYNNYAQLVYQLRRNGVYSDVHFN